MTTPVVQQKQGKYISNVLRILLKFCILESAQTDLERKPPGWGKRHTFALLSFLGFANVFAMRVNLSVTIVKMVSQNISVALHQNSSFEGQTGCQIPNTSADNDIPTPSAQLVRLFRIITLCLKITRKVSFDIASEASYVYKSSLKMPKMAKLVSF